MILTYHPFQNEDDYWRVRQFLRETYLLNQRQELNWQVFRLDYWRWHINENLVQRPLSEAIYLWETPRGELAAVLNSDGRGEGVLQIHPAWASPELEAEMIAVAEERLSQTKEDGTRSLLTWVDSRNTSRQTLLAARGYTKGDWPEHQRYRTLDEPIPAPVLPPGYTIRALGEGLELLERCYASGLAFPPNELDIALDNRRDVTWYRNIQNAPLYRRDLDLIVLDPEGAVAAFTTIWFDDMTRTGSFEPVGTVPAYQRRGIGKAIMFAGLHRLKKIGATQARVGSYSEAAGALYASAGFIAYELSEPWTKVW
ncbi:MAG TPA: GNAT family N-acetyltransferase [Anaerolineales bacterium]|nr:GNAT family N-acetyltransferase [Anaerolineales bacterium]